MYYRSHAKHAEAIYTEYRKQWHVKLFLTMTSPFLVLNTLLGRSFLMQKTVLIRKLSWRLCLPFLLISMAWCFIKGLNPFESPLFLTSILSMIPMLLLKAYELQESVIENQVAEFREMGETEFLNFINEFKKIPLGSFRASYKEAYRQEYLRRYNKDIFHEIPMFDLNG